MFSTKNKQSYDSWFNFEQRFGDLFVKKKLTMLSEQIEGIQFCSIKEQNNLDTTITLHYQNGLK